MVDLNRFVVSGCDFGELMESVGAICRALPPDLGKRLHEIRKDYIARYEFDDVHQRMNDRTVAQIFAQYQPTGAKPFAAGELDGVRYELHKKPSPTSIQEQGETDD